MGYAFISYSSKNQETADAVRSLFNQNGITTWMAPYDIPAGGRYAQEITRAIRDCSCFVLLLSNASQASAAVDSEVELATLTFHRPIITIQLEDVVLNDAFTFYIHNKQIIPIKNVDESAVEVRKILASVIGYTGGEQPSAPPTVSVPVAPSAPPPTDPVTIKTLRVFASDGSRSGFKMFSDTYYVGDLRSIGIRVYPEDEQCREKVALTWSIFTEDGEVLAKDIKTDIRLDGNGEQYVHQWGWNTVGHWKAGVYRVEASLNGGEVAQAVFRVIPGSFGFLPYPSRLNRVLLFEAGAQVPEYGDRRYNVRFSQQTTHRIFFEVHFPQISADLITTMDYVIRNSRGEIVVSRSVPVSLSAGNDVCWAGYGYAEAGRWASGQYSYALSLGKSPVVSGAFLVE